MSGPRLASPSTFRLVAASAAAVASLGVVALGVQLGTHGLVGDGPGRNPGSATATPAAAVVDARPASVPVLTGFDTIAAVSPSVGGGFGTLAGAGSSSGSGSGSTAATPAPAPTDGSGGGAPAPTDPATPVPTPTVPSAPTVTVPPAPAVPPVLDPIVAPVVDVLTDATAAATGTDTTAPAPADSTSTSSTTGTLQGLVDSLLGR